MNRSAFRALPVAALLCTAGCIDLGINDDRVTTIWTAELLAEPQYAGVTGQAAAVSQLDGTVASILVEGAEAGTTYAWGVWLGRCDSPAQQVGPDADYPELVADELGEATRTTRLGPRLSLDQSYHVQVQVGTERSLVACGDLVGEVAS